MDFEKFDVKLKDGRYFKNVICCDEYGLEDRIEAILENIIVYEDRIKEVPLQIYKEEDEDCENILAEVLSDEIEYICKAYKYKEEL